MVRTVEEGLGKYMGVFYILEWDDAVKIGSTKHPYQRLMQLKSTAEKYGRSKLGRVAISIPHTNYVESEKALHKYFSSFRRQGTEIFDIEFDLAIPEIPRDIEYADNSEQIERQGEVFCEGAKKLLLGKTEEKSSTSGTEINQNTEMETKKYLLAKALLEAMEIIKEQDKLIATLMLLT